MSEVPLLARLHDRPGALERAIGLIRRRAHGIDRISIASARSGSDGEIGGAREPSLSQPPPSQPPPAGGRSSSAGSQPLRAGRKGGHPVIELVLRVDESRTSRERVRRDLLGLEDLIDVRDLDGDVPATRELLLAWIRTDAAPHAAGNGRVVAVSGATSLLEFTGTPTEIDALLARLDELDAVAASVRSGEVAAPMTGFRI